MLSGLWLLSAEAAIGSISLCVVDASQSVRWRNTVVVTGDPVIVQYVEVLTAVGLLQATVM
jgi:hypothetical protein